mmetsp:Transcript_61734/g.135239  ORF Transcript_61734/g.135239 Transcript_61734/m.135239 type:complete len:246 (+) Transcript_61734:2109-2846(+)
MTGTSFPSKYSFTAFLTCRSWSCHNRTMLMPSAQPCSWRLGTNQGGSPKKTPPKLGGASLQLFVGSRALMRRCCNAITCPSTPNCRNGKSMDMAAAKRTQRIQRTAVLLPGSSRILQASSPAKTSRRPGELNMDSIKDKSHIQEEAKTSKCRGENFLFQGDKRMAWYRRKINAKTRLTTMGKPGHAAPAGLMAKMARRSSKAHAPATISLRRKSSCISIDCVDRLLSLRHIASSVGTRICLVSSV